MVRGTFLSVQDVNSIHSQPVTRVMSAYPLYCYKLLFLPLQLQHVLSLAGWNAAFSPDGDAFSLSLIFCPLGHYCPYTINPGGRWAGDLPCCVHFLPVGRKIPVEKWEY